MRTIMHVAQSMDISGRSRVICGLCSVLNKDGFRSIIVSQTPNLRYKESCRDTSVFCLNKREGFDAEALLRLRGIIRKEKVDVIHTHGKAALTYGALAKRISGARYLLHTVHRADGDRVSKNRILRSLITSSIDKAAAVSNPAKIKFAECNGFPLSRMEVIHNGVDIPPQAPSIGGTDMAPAELRSLKAAGKTIIGTVANLSYDKDFGTLMDAFSKAASKRPGSAMVIVGDGPRRDELKALAEKRGVGKTVIFLGARNDVPLILPMFDLFVLSTRTEGFGISIIEAMAAKLPVIASDVGGVKDIIEDNVSGRLFPQGDSDGLMDLMLTLSADKESSKRLGEAGRALVEQKFSLQRMCSNYKKLYEDAERA